MYSNVNIHIFIQKICLAYFSLLLYLGGGGVSLIRSLVRCNPICEGNCWMVSGAKQGLGEKSDENLCLNRWRQSQYCFPIVKLIVGFRQLESTIHFVDIVTGVTKIATLT